jgi:hypothetical protein
VWSRPDALRNFSIVRKFDGRPWPTGGCQIMNVHGDSSTERTPCVIVEQLALGLHEPEQLQLLRSAAKFDPAELHWQQQQPGIVSCVGPCVASTILWAGAVVGLQRLHAADACG